jgi:putative ABC transport system permease protein
VKTKVKKKALIKDIYREIKRSTGRFLSIMLIIAAGVGFFVGVKATAPSMHTTAERYFNENSLMDFEILSTVGFDDEDVRQVALIEGVEKVMPSYSADLMIEHNDQTVVTKVMSLPKDEPNAINIPMLLEGRLPESEDECIVSSYQFDGEGYQIGDVITFELDAGNMQTDAIVSRNTYTVVGIADLPLYISYSFGTSSIGNGIISSVLMIPSSNFIYSRYTELFVTLLCHKQGITAFEDDYDLLVSDFSASLSALGDERYSLFVRGMQEQIDEAQKKLDSSQEEADHELKEAAFELEDARQQIDEGLKRLEEGWKDYEQGSEDAQSRLEKAAEEIVSLKKLLAQREKDLLNGKREYELGLAEAEAELARGRRTLDENWAEYNDGLAEFNKSKEQYDTYVNEYEDGQRQLSAARAEYAAALEEYESAKQQLETARDAVDSMEAQLEEYENGGSVNITPEQLELLRQGIAESKAELASMEEELETMEPGSPEYEELSRQIESLRQSIAYAEEQLEAYESGGNIELSEEELRQLREALETAKRELDTYEEQLADSERQLESASDQIEEGESELAAASEQLNEAKEKISLAEKELNDAKMQLNDAEDEYARKKDDAYAQLESARLEIESGEVELNAAYGRLVQGERQLAESKAEADIQFQEAYEELVSYQTELEKAQEEYQKSLNEYDKALMDAESEISKGMNRIQNARSELGEVVAGKWYVFSRDEIMVNYSSFKLDAERISAIADVFPAFFLMVAALICLTTMTRMVDEQRTQIGIYKALGYSSSSIASKYLVYSTLACIIGCIIGPVICVQVLPRVIFGAYSVLYRLPDFTIKMPWDMLAVSVAVALCCTALVAGLSCRRELKVITAALMRPKAPKAGKKIWLERIPRLWKRFSFSHKITARNLFRYKSRLLMTVFGISGCMALIVAGFGLQNAIAPIVDRQYSQLSYYDMTLILSKNYSPNEIVGLKAQLLSDERVESFTFVYEGSGKVLDWNEKASFDEVYLIMPQSIDEIGNIVNLRRLKDKSSVELKQEGVVITEKISRLLGASEGAEIKFMVGEKVYILEVTDVVENYIYNYIYISPEYYLQIFEKEPSYNTVYASQSSAMTDTDEFASHWLRSGDNVIMVFFTSMASDAVEDTLSSLRVVILVMILCAGILAFIVLYNLTNINISERLREIATIKVLGFNHFEVNMYIFRENLIMCLLGIFLGSILGYFMARYIISTVEVNVVMFSQEILFSSYLYAALLTLFFALLVNLFMVRRVKAISMVESLKAVE